MVAVPLVGVRVIWISGHTKPSHQPMANAICVRAENCKKTTCIWSKVIVDPMFNLLLTLTQCPVPSVL